MAIRNMNVIKGYAENMSHTLLQISGNTFKERYSYAQSIVAIIYNLQEGTDNFRYTDTIINFIESVKVPNDVYNRSFNEEIIINVPMTDQQEVDIYSYSISAVMHEIFPVIFGGCQDDGFIYLSIIYVALIALASECNICTARNLLVELIKTYPERHYRNFEENRTNCLVL